ncbi:MAG: copper chaperone PCu(A)C [Acidimicrobiia bacterium]|nr:copper chaperone PCu(A)C [Acidimicrobiia bacterium]
MTTDSPADIPAPQHKPDIYARIMRFAPLYVIVFCIGILVLVAFIRPFTSPEPTLLFRSELVGAANDPTGAYFLLQNAGGSDTLLGASTPAATSVVLQIIDPTTTTSTPESAATGGTYMTVERIDIPGFTDMKFVAGGNQLLLRGLISPLIIGQKIPITLQFDRAGAITIEAEVQPYTVIADRMLPPRLKLPAGQ